MTMATGCSTPQMAKPVRSGIGREIDDLDEVFSFVESKIAQLNDRLDTILRPDCEKIAPGLDKDKDREPNTHMASELRRLLDRARHTNAVLGEILERIDL